MSAKMNLKIIFQSVLTLTLMLMVNANVNANANTNTNTNANINLNTNVKAITNKHLPTKIKSKMIFADNEKLTNKNKKQNQESIKQKSTKKESTKSVEEKNIYTEDKQTILISAKQPEFILKLKSNPTTGYMWFLREYNANLIQPVKHSFEEPTPKLIGASGFEVWTFKVKPAGFAVPQQTAIRMVYTRPWQNHDSSTQLVFRIITENNKSE